MPWLVIFLHPRLKDRQGPNSDQVIDRVFHASTRIDSRSKKGEVKFFNLLDTPRHQDTMASSVRVSPLLSFQVMATLSPAMAPLMTNCMNGFLDTEVPHSAVNTCLPFKKAVTS